MRQRLTKGYITNKGQVGTGPAGRNRLKPIIHEPGPCTSAGFIEGRTQSKILENLLRTVVKIKACSYRGYCKNLVLATKTAQCSTSTFQMLF